MAAPQETTLKEINHELREEAILRAANFIKGAKLAASAISEVWWTIIPGANISADTRLSRGGFVLFPKMPVRLIPTTESYAEPRTSFTTNEPIELGTVSLASYIAHNNTILLCGSTPLRHSLPPNPNQLPEAAFETVTFSPDEHRLALYVDERR